MSSVAAPRTRRGGRALRPASCRAAAGLELHHVPVEVRRPAHGLARVVDDEVEPVARLVQMPAELLDARRVPQVEAEDLEPVAPDVEVGLLRVPGRRVPRKPRRHDQRGPGPQQLDPGLVADLHPPAREQRDPAGEVGGLGPLGVVEVAARRGRAGRRRDGSRRSAACRRSSAGGRSPLDARRRPPRAARSRRARTRSAS